MINFCPECGFRLEKEYKFCPNCGNPITGSGTLCKNCQTTDFDFKDIKIVLCNNCKSYFYKNKWAKFHDINSVINTVVTGNVKHAVKVSKISDIGAETILEYKAGVKKDHVIKVSVKNEHFDLPMTIEVTLCPKCSKQGTKYFQSILQVRNSTDEIHAFIRNEIAKQKKKGIHLNKEEYIDDTGKNIDYYLTNQSYAKVLAEKLRDNFGGIIKKNAQLFSVSWETSKNLYRLNILVELPRYRKNDAIKSDEQLYKIVSMDEKIHVLNLKTNAKTSLPHKDSYDVLAPVEVMLIKKYPEFEILDPKTYYQARLMNPSETLQINQKIHVIIDGGEAWMIKE